MGVNLTQQKVYAKYRGLIFGFMQGVVKDTGKLRYGCTISGSFHTYLNGGTHNAGRLCLSDFKAVIADFKERFGINPDITQLHKLEFGVNLRLPYSPNRVLKAIRGYKGIVFEPLNNIGLQCKTNLFTLKIYDKSKQLEQFKHDNILRVEMRMKGDFLKRNCAFMQCKIDKKCFLSDLENIEVWREFEMIILDAIENTIIVESVPTDGLKKKEKELFELFIGDGWQSLTRSSLCKKKKRFLELAEKIGALSLKGEILQMIRTECAILKEEAVNVADKQLEVEGSKVETFSRFSKEMRSSKSGNVFALKIKGENVANNATLPAHPPNTDLHGLEHAEIIGHTRIKGKPHLKPPDQDTS